MWKLKSGINAMCDTYVVSLSYIQQREIMAKCGTLFE